MLFQISMMEEETLAFWLRSDHVNSRAPWNWLFQELALEVKPDNGDKHIFNDSEGSRTINALIFSSSYFPSIPHRPGG